MNDNIKKTAVSTIMQIVKLKTNLSEEKLQKRAREREPQFQAIPGIIQNTILKLVPKVNMEVFIFGILLNR